ncbi:MAG: hypothetical protein RBT76_01055 [candidate division Zixibacteria bacterium]|jgi:hypothetical protein|nr:hypothetical protein [candidate division Zixibacteria bacterium]
MDCFFGSYEIGVDPDDNIKAVVTFSIPDVGIKFKAPFNGVNPDHCDFASLLALLEFIDSNQKYFKNHTYSIFGNNRRVIEQVNEKEQAPLSFAPLMAKARKYKRKYRFSLEWVPTSQNDAFDDLLN